MLPYKTKNDVIVRKSTTELNGELRRQFCVKATKKSTILCLKVEDLASIEEVFP